MKKKRILLLGGNYAPEPTGIGKYNGEMMDWLCAQGCECSAITTYPHYPFWKVQPPYEKNATWFLKEKKVINNNVLSIYRCPHYIPQKPTGAKRMMADLSFFTSAFIQLFVLLFKEKYDCVVTVVPAFHLGLLALIYKWIKGSVFIYHVQDLQIDAAKELKMIRSEWLLKLMFRIEKCIICRANYVCSISEGMVKKIGAKFNGTVTLFPNWVDAEAFYPIEKKEELKLKYNFSRADKIILYSGAIGEKQGLEAILFAARDLNMKNVKFVICGSGPYKEALAGLKVSMQLENVIFLPLQPATKFNEFLNMADIHLVLQKGDAKDLVMPSKLSAILAVGGLVLVTAAQQSSLYNIISQNEMGILIEPDSQAALIEAIKNAIDCPYLAARQNARNFAVQHLTINNVLNKFFKEIISAKKVPALLINQPKIKMDIA